MEASVAQVFCIVGGTPPSVTLFSISVVSVPMRIFVCSSSLLALIVSLLGQVYSPNHVTNHLTRSEAVNAASQLKVGMWERDVRQFLSARGLTNSVGEGSANAGWDCFYTLSDGSSLMRTYEGPSYGPRRALLRRACIQSNGVYLVSITLTNRP